MVSAKLSCRFLLVVFIFCVCQAFGSFLESFDKAQFDNAVKSSTVSAVYFYTKDFPSLGNFLKEFEKSAKMLDTFNVKLGKVECQQHAVQPYCSKKNSGRRVFTFKDGVELMEMDLDTMFDMDSIVGNVLQLVLLQEVPIIESKSDLRELQERYMGQNDIVFAWLQAVGSREHRIFMSVAFAYHTEGIKFALTTDKKIVDHIIESEENGKALIWAFHCKRATTPMCARNQYRGNMDLTSVVQHIKALSLPLTHPLVDQTTPFDNFAVHNIYVIHSGEEEKDHVERVAKNLALTFKGVAGVITVDVNAVGKDILESRGLQRPAQIPNVAVQMNLAEEKGISYLNEELTEYSASAFVTKLMQEYLTGIQEPEQTYEEEAMGYDEDEDNQDDAVEEAVFRLKLAQELINTTYIPALTDKTFPTTIKEKNLVAVLFYFKMDAGNMAFLRSFADASLDVYTNSDDSPLASIECWDWTDVCGKQNITHYPVLRIYRKNMDTVEYKGMWDGATVIQTVKMYQKAVSLTLDADEKITQFIAGDLPEQKENIYETSVLGILNGASEKEKGVFNQVAKDLQAEAIFGVAAGSKKSKKSDGYLRYIQENFNCKKTPAVIVLKKTDPFQPHVLYTGSLTNPQELAAFVKQARLHVFPELTPMSLPSYYSKDLPFAILFGEDFKASGVHSTLGHIAASGEVPQMQFAWMDVYDDNSLGAVLLKKYTETPKFPSIAVVNHKQGTVHINEENDLTKDIIKWLQDVQNGNIDATVNLPKGEWKPLKAGYKFLDYVYPDYTGSGAPKSDLEMQEKHGIGFGDEESDDHDMSDSSYDTNSDGDTEKEDEIEDVLELKEKSRIYHHQTDNKQQTAQEGKGNLNHIHTEL